MLSFQFYKSELFQVKFVKKWENHFPLSGARPDPLREALRDLPCAGFGLPQGPQARPHLPLAGSQARETGEGSADFLGSDEPRRAHGELPDSGGVSPLGRSHSPRLQRDGGTEDPGAPKAFCGKTPSGQAGTCPAGGCGWPEGRALGEALVRRARRPHSFIQGAGAGASREKRPGNLGPRGFEKQLRGSRMREGVAGAGGPQGTLTIRAEGEGVDTGSPWQWEGSRGTPLMP